MDLDQVVDDELHPGKPDAFRRQPPPSESRGWARDVDHHRSPRLRKVADVDINGLEGQPSVIDVAFLALCAGQRDLLPLLQDLGGMLSADNRGEPKLAADDRGMARRAAVIGNDAGRPLHDRHPIRVGGFGHKNGSVSEPLDFGRVADQAHLSRRDGLANGGARQQPLTLRRQAIGSDGAPGLVRLHGFRPRLDDGELAGIPVLRPLHVHRAAVVPFDNQAHRANWRISSSLSTKD